MLTRRQLLEVVTMAGTQLETFTPDCVERTESLLPTSFFFVFFVLAALGLRCCARALSSCSEQRLLFAAVCRLLIVVASLVVEHGLQAHGLQ